jgi:hypothetical protein
MHLFVRTTGRRSPLIESSFKDELNQRKLWHTRLIETVYIYYSIFYSLPLESSRVGYQEREKRTFAYNESTTLLTCSSVSIAAPYEFYRSTGRYEQIQHENSEWSLTSASVWPYTRKHLRPGSSTPWNTLSRIICDSLVFVRFDGQRRFVRRSPTI